MLPTRNYAGIDSAFTQRPVSSAILGIDSEDRFKDGEGRAIISSTNPEIKSPYSFTITKETSILNGFFTRIGVTEVNWPWVLPNVNSRTRQIRVEYQPGGVGPVTEVAIVLPDGFYTPAQLATAMQVAVRNIDASLNLFTMVYGIGAPLEPLPCPQYASTVVSSIPAFTYNTNNATKIAFQPMVAPSTNAIAELNYPYPAYTRQLFDVLGLNTNNQTLRTFWYSGYTFCQAVKYFDIVCTQITNNQSLKDNSSQIVNRDMLCRIYVADPSAPSTTDPKSSTFCPAGCMPFNIYRNFATPKYVQWLPNQPVPGVLKVEAYSDDGTLLTKLDLNTERGYNRENWSMTLLVSEN